MQKTIGNFLEAQGFELRTEKAYTGSAFWCFTRKYNQITQSIVVTKSRYYNALSFIMQTDAWGNSFAKSGYLLPGFMERLTTIQKLPQGQIASESQKPIPDFPYHINYLGEWLYDNEVELERAMWEICDVIAKYGLKELERMSYEEEMIPTDEMGEKLFTSYKTLSHQFITNNKIKVMDKSSECISEWFLTISEIMSKVFDSPYVEVQDTLVEIAAFLGEQIKKELQGKWVLGERARIVLIKDLNAFILQSYRPLDSVVQAFKKRRVEMLKEEYILQLSAKLPKTEKEMIEFSERLDSYRKQENNIPR